jgi:hypothetical protein
MTCDKFISIRLEPGKKTRVYIDKVTQTPHQILENLSRFTLRSDIGVHTEKGTVVSIEALQWPPPSYDASVTLSLNSQWPIGTQYYETNDTAGHATGRSFSALEFIYDESAKTLSWNQKNARTPGKLMGSVEFNAITPVWNIVLALDPTATTTKGELLFDGADITAITAKEGAN